MFSTYRSRHNGAARGLNHPFAHLDDDMRTACLAPTVISQNSRGYWIQIMRLRVLANASVLLLSLTIMPWVCSAEEYASRLDGYTGGVFSRAVGQPVPPSPAPAMLSRPLPVFDVDGNSNELIVAFNYKQPGEVVNIATMASETSHADFELAVVNAVNKNDAITRRILGEPRQARHLTEAMRLSADEREAYASDHPREKLERYIVLAYPTVDAAQAAQAVIAQHPAVESVENNRRVEFSWTPADPYYFKSGVPHAGRYQWGLHAMNFASAWDITTGHGYVGAVDRGLAWTMPTGPADNPYPNDPYKDFRIQDGSILPPDLRSNFRQQFSKNPAEWNNSPNDFHGTHVLAIIGATTNNGAGVSGACPTCSVAMAKRTDIADSLATGFSDLINRGFQVINLSATAVNTGSPEYSCSSPGYGALCSAIAAATKRDVLVVAAAGNYSRSAPGFPANQPDVLSVAGIQLNTPNAPSNPSSWAIWWSNTIDPSYGTVGSHAAGTNGVVAPAKSIVSVAPVYTNSKSYAPGLPYECSDYFPDDTSATSSTPAGGNGDGYATCSGTSMAAPHVSALAGILRSINPRLSKDSVKSLIRGAGHLSSSPNSVWGYGLPNARTAVNNALAQTPASRLTPLFSLYSSMRADYFYTTIPQMATAALYGTLEPKRTSGTAYVPSGSMTLSGYATFPDHRIGVGAPRADAWIFTTPQNPKNASIPLVPLHRLSWKCGDSTPYPPTICSSNPEHIDIVYSAGTTPTDTADRDALISWGYKLDGIEGYIYPKTISQPAGTKKLMRKYNPARDDHAIFPDNLLTTMNSQGYTETSGTDWLGYVYPNLTGAIPSIQ